jgi:hypothetical protein
MIKRIRHKKPPEVDKSVTYYCMTTVNASTGWWVVGEGYTVKDALEDGRKTLSWRRGRWCKGLLEDNLCCFWLNEGCASDQEGVFGLLES